VHLELLDLQLLLVNLEHLELLALQQDQWHLYLLLNLEYLELLALLEHLELLEFQLVLRLLENLVHL
jgi:hypothetical protein